MAGNLVKQLTEGLVKSLKRESFEGLLSNLKFTSAGDGSVLCEMKVENRHQNLTGTMHGGMTATLIDSVTSFALLTKNCRGVSVDLNVSYFQPILTGQTILIDAKVLKLGQRVAVASAEIRDLNTAKILAVGRQSLFLVAKNVTIEDGC